HLHLTESSAFPHCRVITDSAIYGLATDVLLSNESHYLNQTELMDILQQGYQVALKRAALEAFEGRYEAQELAAMVDQEEILTQALEFIQQ
ncbi:hypothetical protein H6G91_32705, partial [Nostoc muscorum FACHB-395]|nr:hypothetical protein [Desmonostoc muscorum FACHB-395]